MGANLDRLILTGILKEYAPKYFDAKGLGEHISFSSVPLSDWRDILEYILQAEAIGGYMHYVPDFNNPELFLAPHGYQSDGQFIWPIYLGVFLKKYPHFHLDQIFIDHIRQNGYTPPPTGFSEKEQDQIFSMVEKKLSIDY